MNPKLIAVGVLAAGVGLYFVSRKLSSFSAPSGQVIQDASSKAAVWLGDTASHVFTGAVEGVGQLVGIPKTDAQRCAELKAAGDWWNASFYCPAGDFLSSGAKAVFGSTGVSQAEQTRQKAVEKAAQSMTSPQWEMPIGAYG